MAESEMDSFQQRVFRRAKELSRIKTGKASETVTKTTMEINNESEPHVGLNIDTGNPSTSSSGGNSGRGNHVPANPERDCLLVGGSPTGLWEKITKIEENIRKSEEQNAEILSNVVITVAKMQKTLENNEKSQPEQIPTTDIADNISDTDELDAIMDTNSDGETESNSECFLRDLEETYTESVVYGPAVSEKLSALVNNALTRPLREDSLKNLEEKHRFPENCTKLKVPSVNKELWQAFRSARPADLAMQTCHKYMGMAMVPILKSLDLFLNNGDKNEIKDLTKDAFRLLAQGMCVNTLKRKELIRPSIPMKYRKVCTDDGASSDFLFGDNLEQKVDDIEKEEKRAKKLLGYQHTTKPFLDQRRSQGPQYQQRGQRSRDQKYSRHQLKPYHKIVKGKSLGKPMAKGHSWKK